MFPLTEIQINEQELAHALSVYQLLPTQAEAAAYRALRKTVKWMQVIASREISQEMKLTQKIIRRRLKVFIQDKQALRAKIWMGLYSFRASSLGSLRQTRAGVTAGRHQFPGAFVATMKNGHKDAFVRKGHKRLPIEIEKLDITEEAKTILLDVASRTDRRFMENLHHELSFELQKSVSHAH